ncbi:hypothetical protein [Clostridium drakei]|uniref:Uncharacterized protein n=1 Tax=Clostridium drakei TaxID=332101 RepID=A0A2U8DX27_9CLOT|nr:hypothetical protein [Clostridium drakei]AWI07209.1 hypothetical protein B9W14_22945 [Clostridium drakei]
MSKKKKITNWSQNYIKKPNKRNINWRIILIGYIIGYIISLCITGIPKLTYLIPIKVDAMCISILITSLSKVPKKPNKTDIEIRWNGVVYGIISLVLLVVVVILLQILLKYNIITDIRPFLGMFGCEK